MKIQPFEIAIPQAALDDLHQRLSRTRWPDEIPGSEWNYGSNLTYMKDLIRYWQTPFDWRSQEHMLNTFAHFRTTIVKANLLLTHFGNLKWTHPHGGERESVFRHSERATALICSAMAAQSVPSEEPGIKVAPLLFALLTSGSSDGLKNAPIAFAKKTTSCFFAQEE